VVSRVVAMLSRSAAEAARRTAAIGRGQWFAVFSSALPRAAPMPSSGTTMSDKRSPKIVEV
jgi:hypothetical protein